MHHVSLQCGSPNLYLSGLGLLQVTELYEMYVIFPISAQGVNIAKSHSARLQLIQAFHSLLLCVPDLLSQFFSS